VSYGKISKGQVERRVRKEKLDTQVSRREKKREEGGGEEGGCRREKEGKE
jgi:hypothetical protein